MVGVAVVLAAVVAVELVAAEVAAEVLAELLLLHALEAATPARINAVVQRRIMFPSIRCVAHSVTRSGLG